MFTNITFEYEYLMSLLCDWFEIYKIDTFSGYLPVMQIIRTSPDKHKENICYLLNGLIYVYLRSACKTYFPYSYIFQVNHKFIS